MAEGWDDYTNQLVGTCGVVQAALIGNQDGAIWARSGGFNLNEAEKAPLLAGLTNLAIPGKSFILNKVKYFTMAVDVDQALLYGKSATGGVCLQKTNQTIVIGICSNHEPLWRCSIPVGELSKFLLENNL